MLRKSGSRFLLSIVLVWVAALPAFSDSVCDPDGFQKSGSIYRICMPAAEDYNGRLVIWAHGFQDAGTPVSIPEDQLQFGDYKLWEIVNGMGFGFATCSYSKTGLAIRQGMDDILDLVKIYAGSKGAPKAVYLLGASEGGIITALLTEQRPDRFKAGYALCGPVGDFPFQMKYFGDARATFQYFFPNLIPGDPFNPAPDLIAGWRAFYKEKVMPAVLDPKNRKLLDQWVKVADLPYDRGNYLQTVEVSVRDVLRYSVVNLQDAVETLGGFPFENRFTWYHGSKNDLRLNRKVPRRAADPAAVREMKANYNTTGRLDHPLITMHTLKDQQIPYIHEFFYNLKTFASGDWLVRHLNIPIPRFGHCNFKPAEAVAGFAVMLFYAGDLKLLTGVGSLLAGEELARFEALAQEHGIPYEVGGALLMPLMD
jgi:pimeloyl-ACP methyl ester carboxylesterase